MSIIALDHVTKRFCETIALNDFSLHVEAGELFGLLGPNGAGKTTAISVMLNLYPADSGTIRIFDHSMPKDEQTIKRRVGIVPQHVSVYDQLTVFENIQFFAELYGFKPAEAKQKTVAALDFVELTAHQKKRPPELSGGLLRRLNIACGIVHEPELIFMDEPTVAIDPQSRNTILENIRELNRRGATIIYTSHYMEEVEMLCDRVAIVDEGRIIAEGTQDELKDQVMTLETARIKVDALTPGLLERLESLERVKKVDYEEPFLDVSLEKDTPLAPLLDVLHDERVRFTSITVDRPSLNTVFLALTGKTLRE
ncbi:ABC transporter ATP-binding protein [Exiguobacterium mexicanum]|uniref:ABC transporter ATP-binding protein n=1 Tax=Exiguobacterium mexicanum TaxID=340146 RepID=A0ABT7MMS2_9BACL|nr:ABC transporter ATP-binding protein [Exiguobacterium mexicanum]MDL5376481.1 ABC transporter ATP-binding protein [Exiguobacterium mexicanum]